MDQVASFGVRDSSAGVDLLLSMSLELTIHDADTITELLRIPEGYERDQFAAQALRIGVLALRQARGQFDADAVQRESERLLLNLDNQLQRHSAAIHDRLNSVLREYFDPQSGRFPERVERLVKKDGDLELLLRRQIGSQDSELCHTLLAHFGEDSPLMKSLSPDQSKGLLFTFRGTLDEQLAKQREHVLQQFSLDNKEGALSRFINELTERQGQLSLKLEGRLDEVVKEFSLDEEDSALNRLVRNVDRAQQTITSQFSLDEETSALSRLKRLLENTNRSIDGHLSLDDKNSALARLKDELMTLLKEHRETNQKFQEEVKVALQSMLVRREEAARSTTHGIAFEEAVCQQLQREAQRVGDVSEETGCKTGLIKNCKVGDCVIELGPESAAPGGKVVVEAKEKAGYDLAQAREEIDKARKNRGASVGLFVFSQRTAPPGLERLTRLGQDVFVVWDQEDTTADLYLRAGLSLARALCVRNGTQQQAQAADFAAIDAAILEIDRQLKDFDQMSTWAGTIQSNSGKILEKVGIIRKSLESQIAILNQKTGELKELLATPSE